MCIRRCDRDRTGVAASSTHFPALISQNIETVSMFSIIIYIYIYNTMIKSVKRINYFLN